MPPSATRSRVLAPVMEVFASIQGEGLHVGEPQVFLRLYGCPMRCRWCDTPGSFPVSPEATARIDPVGSPPKREPAWVGPFQVACWIADVEPGAPRTVSVTGGEPLVWPGFLVELKKYIGERRLHLETAGGHPEALARVLDVFDHVSLDLKLPADMGTPVSLTTEGLPADPSTEPPPGSEDEWRTVRRRCLDLVKDTDSCAKVVVSAGREPREYEELFLDVVRRAPELPVFLQPVSPVRGVEAPSMDLVVSVAELARDLGLEVRVVPQVHKALRIP